MLFYSKIVQFGWTWNGLLFISAWKIKKENIRSVSRINSGEEFKPSIKALETIGLTFICIRSHQTERVLISSRETNQSCFKRNEARAEFRIFGQPRFCWAKVRSSCSRESVHSRAKFRQMGTSSRTSKWQRTRSHWSRIDLSQSY